MEYAGNNNIIVAISHTHPLTDQPLDQVTHQVPLY